MYFLTIFSKQRFQGPFFYSAVNCSKGFYAGVNVHQCMKLASCGNPISFRQGVQLKKFKNLCKGYVSNSRALRTPASFR